ncbi:MAG: prepilin peptidase [Planctomycetes bacterium]|nr:prepilin peptidase [Planctomycetota bacterium]
MEGDAVRVLSTTSLLFAALIIATYTDVVHHKIYNWCTLPATALGLVLNLLLAPGTDGLVSSLAGLALGFGVFLVAWLLGGLGAADMKLMGAVGAIQGYPFVVDALVWTAAVGAFMACVALVARGRLLRGLARSFALMFSLRHGLGLPDPVAGEAAGAAGPAQVTIPYGLAIAAGTSLAWFLHLLSAGAR